MTREDILKKLKSGDLSIEQATAALNDLDKASKGELKFEDKDSGIVSLKGAGLRYSYGGVHFYPDEWDSIFSATKLYEAHMVKSRGKQQALATAGKAAKKAAKKAA